MRDGIARLVDDEAVVDVVDVGGGVRMAKVDDPARRYLVEHTCKTVGDTTLVIAPSLSAGHQVLSEDPLTITPSILCPDCGLHGFVTEGLWRTA